MCRRAGLDALFFGSLFVFFAAVQAVASDDAVERSTESRLKVEELNALIDGPPVPMAPAVVTRDANGKATLRATRLETPLVIDGRLEERVYRTVPAIDGFVQQEPHQGEPASDVTEVWIFYDATSVYVSARLRDEHPERIVANELRRDNRNIENNNDSFAVIFDTFYDHRNGFLFRTNALGALWDAQVTDESNTNSDWNTVWYVKSVRDAGGWSLEMSIPFKSLRYRAGASQLWGVNFQRLVRATNERSHLTPIPAAFDREGLLKLSFAATLVGIEPPERSMNLELKPYVTGAVNTDLTADVPYENQGDTDFGFDVKYGVTKGLIFDFTYHTDFAQVEADETQVNLTRFGLFFPEKREFFLEGQGIFNFGAKPSNRPSNGSTETPFLFFSRRIGLTDDYAVPIAAGGRLTGRAGPYSVGLLNITTDALAAGAIPQTNYSVFRLKRDVLRRSNIGVIGTYRSENSEGTGDNAAVGVDGNFTFYENLNVSTYVAKTRTPGLAGGDLSYRAAVEFDRDLFGFSVEHLLVDESFNPDIGFVLREDIRKTGGGARYSIRPKSIPSIRKADFEGRYSYFDKTSVGAAETEILELETRVRMESGDFINVNFTHDYEHLYEEFEISDGVILPIGDYSFDRLRAGVWLGGQRRISGWVGGEFGSFYGGDRTELSWRGRIEVTPQLSLEPNVSLNWIDLPQGAFQTNLARVRATYTLSARTFVGALIQYNSSEDSLSSNVRFRWEYRPGSDLFFVYSDGRNTLGGARPALESRSVVVKFTKLFRF